MPTYIMLSSLTPEGVQTVKNNPQRIKEVNNEVEQLGATVKAQWATLGHVDFIYDRRGARREHDRARLAGARLARHRALRDAGRDPRRGLHLVAVGDARICCCLDDRAQQRAPARQHGDPGGGAPHVAFAPAPLAEAEVEAELEGIDVDAPRVGIVMGSKSDMEVMQQAARELEERGILHEVRVMSAHREPDVVADYAKNAHMRGLRVIIAGAGISAALPGAVAAHTDLPVIGVPLSGRLSAAGGLDAILSIVQMPPGVPVACVGSRQPAQRRDSRRADPQRLARSRERP